MASNDPASDLRAVFSWSYDSLTPELARAFRFLGRYPGGDIGVPGAAALLDADLTQTRGLLDKLTAVHLLEERRPGRYRWHDLLREYAVERLDIEESDAQQRAALRRVLDWYAHAANDTRTALGFGRPHTLTGAVRVPAVPRPEPPDSARAFEWFESERENLIGATASAARHGFLDHGWQLARAVRDFLDRRLYSDDWLVVAELGLDCAERADDPAAIGNAALALGGAYSNQRRFDDAEASLRIALETARSLDDPVAMSRAASVLGLNRQRTEDYDRAREYHQQAELAARRAPDRVVRAHALLNYGASEINAGQYDIGIERSTEALRIYRELGVELQQALALGNIAEAYEMTGDFPSAIECCELALVILRRLGDTSGLVDTLRTLGRVRAAIGQPDAARSAWQEAIGLLRAKDRRNATLQALIAGL